MQKPKFEVGDRVEDKYRGEGTIIDIIKQFMLYLVEYDRKIVGDHNGNGICDVKGKEGHCYYENAIDLKRVEEKDMKETIVIYRNGKETIALFKRDNKVIRKANARCHPDDTYDFKAGADIAYKRLMGFPNVVETLKKENEDLKEQIRSYDGIRSNNADMINRNAELEERVKLLQNRNKSLSMSCNQWAENFAQLKRNKDTAVHNLGEENANLREQLSKQKEINKEQVDENKKLKAEIGKLKPFKDEIIIGDTVEITDGLATFSNYKVWLDEYAPYLMNRYKLHKTPRRGDAGIVMAKAKHYRSGEMLYAVLINGQVYIMGERSIKLHNN